MPQMVAGSQQARSPAEAINLLLERNSRRRDQLDEERLHHHAKHSIVTLAVTRLQTHRRKQNASSSKSLRTTETQIEHQKMYHKICHNLYFVHFQTRLTNCNWELFVLDQLGNHTVPAQIAVEYLFDRTVFFFPSNHEYQPCVTKNTWQSCADSQKKKNPIHWPQCLTASFVQGSETMEKKDPACNRGQKQFSSTCIFSWQVLQVYLNGFWAEPDHQPFKMRSHGDSGVVPFWRQTCEAEQTIGK